MLVTVNAALDHFFCRKDVSNSVRMAAKYHTVGKRAFEITASLPSVCQIFLKRALAEFAECLCPSPNRRLWNAISLEFVFRQHYSPTGPMSKMEKNRGRIKWLQERFLLIVVRKHEFCQLKGIQLLNFLSSSLWNYLLLQICNEDRIILRGSIFFSKNTFFTIFRRENSLNWENKKQNKKTKKTVHFS